jgi:hypothetical protein
MHTVSAKSQQQKIRNKHDLYCFSHLARWSLETGRSLGALNAGFAPLAPLTRVALLALGSRRALGSCVYIHVQVDLF